MAKIEQILEKYGSDPAEIQEILLDVQEEEGYLSQDSLRLLSEKLSLPLSKLYHMATFYEALSLEPLGRYQFQVCTGTACHDAVPPGCWMNSIPSLKSTLAR